MTVAQLDQLRGVRSYLEDRIFELEQRIIALEAKQPPEIDYGSDVDLPEECATHRCSYFTHYLAYGGPDLTHEGYHAASKLASQHISHCGIWKTANRPCQQCIDWEQRIRA